MAKPNSVVLEKNTKMGKLLSDLFTEEVLLKVGLVGNPEMGGKTGADPKEFYDKDGNLSLDEDVNIATVGLVHEFGDESSGIPQRSFLRSTYNEQEDRLEGLLIKELQRQINAGFYDPEKAVKKIGVYMVGKIKGKFTNNNWPALKDPTRGGRNKDGGATPLVDTGQLRASIDYEIVKGKS